MFPYLETGSAVKKALKKENIYVNDEPGTTGYWVKAGDVIRFELRFDLLPFQSTLFGIAYEDDDLVVGRKNAGTASSGYGITFQLLLRGKVSIDKSEDGLPYPYLIHRLDKATSGLLIAAKNMTALRILNEMLASNQIKKDYILICEGHLDKSCKWIDVKIDGKVAKTEILSINHLKTKDKTSRVTVRLHTGRTHQIRKHLLSIGHPLVGDQLYNQEGLNFKTGLLLHAYRLEFNHPRTDKHLVIEDDIPSKITKYQDVIAG